MNVFVTGASGHLGSAVIPDLVSAGHRVTGLARSDNAADAVAALGASVRRADLADHDALAVAAREADGVIHLAYDHEQLRTGNGAAAVALELAAVGALGAGLAGSGKPLVTTSGAPGPFGRPATEEDPTRPGGRGDAEIAVVGFAKQGVRSSVVRLPPIVHSHLDEHGFARALIGIARRTGVAGYAGDGANRWPAVNTLDAARVYRLALERAEPGTRWHAIGEEGVAMRQIAEAIGEHLGLSAAPVPDDRLEEHFGFLATLITLDLPMSNAMTRRALNWEPTHPDLREDFNRSGYFTDSSRSD